MLKLVVLSQGLTGLSHEIKGETTTVGRSDDNTFTIPEASVSGNHCEIVQRGEAFFVKDLESTNGTFIDGGKVKTGPLKPGQILRIGNIDVRFETGEGGTPAAGGDQTVVIPKGKGLLREDMQNGGKTTALSKGGPFKKQSNKGTKVFIGAIVAVVIIIAGLLIVAVQRIK